MPIDKNILAINKLRQMTKAENVESPVVELEIRFSDGTFFKLLANVISPVVSNVARFPVNQEQFEICFGRHGSIGRLANW